MNPLERCAVTTGFFVLGRCDGQPVAACGGCGTPLCDAHAREGGGWCPACRAASEYDPANPYAPQWLHGFRQQQYHHASVAYSDTSWYTSFNDFDRGAFEPGEQWDFGGGDSTGFADDDGSGFVDS